ncbi:MAG: hypothetical protein ACYSUC_11745 [Planctomycetota bacterium]|jgi:hypothetical protein
MDKWIIGTDENGIFMVICAACGEIGSADNHMPYYTGRWYHEDECYNTLFAECDNCHQKNMTVPMNLGLNGEDLCDKCYMEKHNLRVVTLVF